MDPKLRTVLWAVGGLVIAAALSLGAFAVAGGRISQPAGNVHVSHTHDEGETAPSERPTPSAPKSPDDDHHSPTSRPSGELNHTKTSSPTHSTSTPTASPSESRGSGSNSGSSGSGGGQEHEGGDD